MNFDLQPASDLPLPDLVQTLNRGFEEYLVPIHLNVSQFLAMVRKDSIDLTASRVLLVDAQPEGVALIARRGWVSRLAAMGISTPLRGKGAGSWLMERLLRQARERGDREMTLEVIEQNDAAVHLYQKFGFQTIRRLLGFIRREAIELQEHELKEMDLRQMGALISQFGMSDLPWQLSGETIAQMTPPVRAYRNGQAYVAVSNPEADHVVIWSLLVEPQARGKNLGTDVLKQIIAKFTGRTWHVPAIYPEELGGVFERAGFELEHLSQWQMCLSLSPSA
ncbi:MAG: GNAT family N-acetyltransferase [Chloroflexota bacterium]